MTTEELIERLRKRANLIGLQLIDPPRMQPDAQLMREAADALRTALAQLDEAQAELAMWQEVKHSTHWKAQAEAAEARLEELTRERDEAKAWLPIRNAPRDGSIIVGRYQTMHDAPNGPYYGYVLMQWDELEGSGWMTPDGLDDIEDPVDVYRVVVASAFLHQGGSDAR